MKKYVLILAILSMGNNLIARTLNANKKTKQQEIIRPYSGAKSKSSAPGTMTVNVSDTVMFDLAHAVINGNHVDIPVSILSDDTIYALDFSLKFNQVNLVFDSVINLTGYIQPFSFYNAMDSTLRFTSNSLQSYGLDTSIVSIRFTMLSGQISNADLNSPTAYLNGDACSIKVMDIIPTAVKTIDTCDHSILIYPNPANEIVNVEMSERATIQLFDMNGKPVTKEINVSNNLRYEIDTRNLSTGIYMLKIQNENRKSIEKILICK